MALFNYECDEVKHIIDEVSPNYPQLTTYISEWLYFYENEYTPGTPVELEYQEVIVNPYGNVNNAIPYNYKSAILKGKSIKNYKNNLFDNVLEKGAISISTGVPNETNLRCYRSVNFIPINGKFKIAKYGVSGDLHVCFYDSNKSFISGKTYVLRNVIEGNTTVTPPTNSSFIKFYNPYDTNEPTGEYGFGVVAENEMIELEIQSVKMPVLTTSNEDGTKTNILTVNEEVELRGVGNVQDELNLLTGEVTERIGEIVLNEDITGYLDTNYSLNGYSSFRVTTIANIPNGLRNVICDKVKYYPNINLNWGKQEEFFTANGNLLFVKILSTKASNFEDLRTFLSSSPITIQYEIAESIKTVDLTKLNKPFEGINHYHLTANIPCEAILEVPVVSTGEQTLQEINND